MDEVSVCRPFRGEQDRERHYRFLPRLAAAELVPRIIRIDNNERCLERCEPLSSWRKKSDQSEIKMMGRRVLEMIRAMHSLGICHRDLHDDNVVVKAGKPLVIDLEHAVEVDPAWPCYDLYGPNDLIPLLPEHVTYAQQLGPTGIWWGAYHEQRHGLFTMGMIFGPIEGVEAITLEE